MNHTTDIVGYTHSDGYCLCPEHADYGEMKDEGNESGRVQPIFAGDECDYQPPCDVAGCGELEEVVVLEDSVKSWRALQPVTYSLLVSNVGWVIQNHPDYGYVYSQYQDYVLSEEYEQVSMWASDQDDPLHECLLALREESQDEEEEDLKELEG